MGLTPNFKGLFLGIILLSIAILSTLAVFKLLENHNQEPIKIKTP